jgi:hypothetical protein
MSQPYLLALDTRSDVILEIVGGDQVDISVEDLLQHGPHPSQVRSGFPNQPWIMERRRCGSEGHP